MRIGELARRSGVAIPTIKYYLRTGLLALGTATAHNQALYDSSHLRTLRLVRALTGIGGLSVDATRALLTAARDANVAVADLVAMSERASMPKPRDRIDSHARRDAEQLVMSVIGTQGWQVRRDGQALARLMDICTAAHLLEVNEIGDVLSRYAEAAGRFAACDAVTVAAIAQPMASGARDRAAAREALVVAIVLGGALQAAMRSLALEDALTRVPPADASRAGAAEV
ncbi:MerR family transcriptional regulator [Micromonospora sp. NPDC003776]